MIIASQREQSGKLVEHLHRRDGSSTLVLDRFYMRQGASSTNNYHLYFCSRRARVPGRDRSVWLRLQPDGVWPASFPACDTVSIRNLTEVDKFVRTITLTGISWISGYIIYVRVRLNWSRIFLRTPSVRE